MSELSGFACDYCGKKIEENGNGIWIRPDIITGDIIVGRHKNAGHKFERLDFCSTEHMVKFIEEKLKGE